MERIYVYGSTLYLLLKEEKEIQIANKEGKKKQKLRFHISVRFPSFEFRVGLRNTRIAELL